MALVLSLETFVTIKTKVPFKEKERQRNELKEAMVSCLSMYPFLSSLGKQASRWRDHRLYFEFVCYNLKAFFKGDT